MNKLILSVKRGKTPFHRLLKRIVGRIFRPTVPRIPNFSRPLLRFVYDTHWMVICIFRAILALSYRGPLFRARCAKFGKNVVVDGFPYVSGHVDVEIGDNCYVGGQVSILSGRMVDQPRLVLHDSAEIGWGVMITVNREVVIEEHARVAYGCRISDSDAHPKEMDLRANNEPPRLEDIRAIRICRGAWIGNSSHVLKGVTIGEGAIVGANSVVVSDVPPYALAVGNPARVFLKDVGLPSTAKSEAAAKAIETARSEAALKPAAESKP